MLDEFGECEEAARKSPVFREAMKKRGIEDLSLVMVDAWSAGHYGNEPPEDRGKRLVRALVLGPLRRRRITATPDPIEDLVAVVDLNRKEVVRVEDYGVVPAAAAGRATGARRVHQGDPRPTSSRWRSRSPTGRASRSQGHEVRWQKWAFRVGFNPREGLVLHTVGYDGRPVLYRGSIAEMIVPYADPKASSYRKNVFDLGEYGVGMLANSLALGCDCLGTIRYFDAHLADNQGPGRHDQERDLPPRGGLRHALEAHRLADRPVGGPPVAAAGRLDGRHRRATTTTASTGTSIRTARSRWRSSSPGS